MAKASKKSAKKTIRDLTDKDRVYGLEYVANKGNAYKAAKAAGYAETTALKCAASWIGKTRSKSVKPHLFDFVRLKTKKIIDKLEISDERILLEYARLAFLDPADFYDKKTGALLPIHEIPEDARRALGGAKTEVVFTGKGENKVGAHVSEIKHSTTTKKASLDSLSKIRGLMVDRKEHSGPGGGPILTSEVKGLTREELMEIAKGER
jgi:phage terminase small subunit